MNWKIVLCFIALQNIATTNLFGECDPFIMPEQPTYQGAHGKSITIKWKIDKTVYNEIIAAILYHGTKPFKKKQLYGSQGDGQPEAKQPYLRDTFGDRLIADVPNAHHASYDVTIKNLTVNDLGSFMLVMYVLSPRNSSCRPFFSVITITNAKEATMTTAMSLHSADYCIDDDVRTWCASRHKEPWLQIDLKHMEQIHNVELLKYYKLTNKFQIRVANNKDMRASRLCKESSKGDLYKWNDIFTRCEGKVKGQFIRILPVDLEHGYFALAEFKINVKGKHRFENYFR